MPHLHGDGDGWVRCTRGHRHWGLHGAAGMLVVTERDGAPTVLLQHRAEWTHHGGTWGLLGGARRSVESAVEAAAREAAEEGGLEAAATTVAGLYVDDHGGWAYTTVLATAPQPLPVSVTGPESAQVRWTPVAAVEERPLHPGFADSWPLLREELAGIRIVVDAANVVGSRPDGWWRDRAGAARRLLARLRPLADGGIAASDAPVPTALQRVWPRWEVVLEGAARAAADDAPPPAAPSPDREGGADRLAVVRATGAGDDTIAPLAGGPEPTRTVVVTADRGLAARVTAVGAAVVGPGWLLGLLDREQPSHELR